MEVFDFGTVDFNNLERAFNILKNIDNNEESITPEELSRIAIDAHKTRYILPLSKKYGSLFLFAIERHKYKVALFLINHGVTINDSIEDINNSIDLAEDEYRRIDLVDSYKKLYESTNSSAYLNIYESELQNSEALNRLKELYPAKKRVLN